MTGGGMAQRIRRRLIDLRRRGPRARFLGQPGKLVDEGEEAGIPVLAVTAVGMPQGTWWDTDTRSPSFTRSTSSDLRPLSPIVGRPRDGEVSSFAEPHFIVVP